MASAVLHDSYCTVLLYHTVSYSTALHCIVQHCTTLYPTALHYTVSYSTALHCIVQACIILYPTAIYYTVSYSTALYNTILLCTALNYTTPNCTALLYTAGSQLPLNMPHCTHCTAVHYILLYCTVLYCTVLQQKPCGIFTVGCCVLYSSVLILSWSCCCFIEIPARFSTGLIVNKHRFHQSPDSNIINKSLCGAVQCIWASKGVS